MDENTAREQRREHWKAVHGYTEVGGKLCIMRLLGQRCLKYYPKAGLTHVCEPPAGDHMHLWRDTQGELLFTSQPYGLSGEAAQETIEFCQKHGLMVTISPFAWHHSGCLLLEFRSAKLGEKNGYAVQSQ